MKKVSVILTTYNSQKFIEKTINSINKQIGIGSDFDLELIVVDDCSTDKTTEILERYNIAYLSTKTNSGGPNKGRNIGLKASSGDYICIADHDDEWNDNRVLKLLPHLEQAPIVTSGYTLIDKNSDSKIVRVNQSEKAFSYYDKNITFKKTLTRSLERQNTYLGSIIYRSELKNILFEEYYGVIDYDWILRLFYQNSSIEVNASLYTRFVGGNNLSLNEDYRIKDLRYSLESIDQYKEKHPSEYRISYKKIHGSMGRYYYLMGNMKKARFYFLKSEFNIKTIMYY
ncbi:MAG: hypothetical protein DRI54_07610, partial [Bacteroidetes bacterium]